MSMIEEEPAPLPIPMTTLRDYMAAQALIALYSCQPFTVALAKEVKKDSLDFKVSMAQHAYLMADAMIVERER